MRFIEKWSFGCAKYLATSTNQNHNKRSLYYYGFYIIISTFIKALIIFTTALLLNILIPTLIVVFIFASLRTFAGGYHMDTVGKCLFVSIFLYLFAALFVQKTFHLWNTVTITSFIIFTLVLGFFLLRKYAPKDNPNKPITDPIQIKKFKKKSQIYLFILIILSTILAFQNLYIYVLSICFGILLELFSITPIGYKFFNIIKNRFTFKKERSA